MQFLMEKIYNSKLSKKIIKFFSVCSLCLSLAFLTFSFISADKQFVLIKKIPTLLVRSVSIDRYSNIFVGDDKGNIIRYDSTGMESLRFSPQKKGEISLLEAWRSVNIFLFYRELQEYTILDRFLTTSSPNLKFVNEVNDTKNSIGFARLATIAADNNLWIFDDVDFSIKKYNTSTNNIIITTPLELILDPSTYELTFLREYQNLLFLCDRNSGILIFDNLGNLKTKIEIQGVSYFNFYNNYVYYLSDGKLVMKNLYKDEVMTYALPESNTYSHILLSNSMAYCFGKDFIDLYKFNFKE